MKQQVREMTQRDARLIVDYFLQSEHQFLTDMGVELKKLPPADQWINRLTKDLERPIEHKKFCYLIWELDQSPVGHSNINKIIFGKAAYMHLHLWQSELRQRGLGTAFISQSISVYFKKFNLQALYCEPHAMNPAPNKTLEKVGFTFVKKYNTIPGWINFYQPVNRWVLTRDSWLKWL